MLLRWLSLGGDRFGEHELVRHLFEFCIPWEVATHAEETKYSSLPVTHNFIPVAIETSGVMGPQSLHFLGELGRRVGRQTGDPLASSHLFQRLSTAIQRGNSASIMGGLRGHD